MKIYRYFILILLFPAAAPALQAQQNTWNEANRKASGLKDKGKQKAGMVRNWKDHVLKWGLDSNYNHALSLGAKLNSNGWTGGACYLKQRSAGKQALWQLQFSEIRHEKEVKQQRTGETFRELGRFRPFMLGKINYCYTLQLGYGREQLLFPALLDGNVSVGFRYAVGPSVAFLKPVYLNLIYTEYTPDIVSHIQTEKYGAGNREKFLKPSDILGAEKWSKGLGETKIIPGAFAEAAFTLEPDRPKSFVKTVVLGGQIAAYTQKLVIIADRKAYSWQASLFVGVNVGKRWK